MRFPRCSSPTIRCAEQFLQRIFIRHAPNRTFDMKPSQNDYIAGGPSRKTKLQKNIESSLLFRTSDKGFWIKAG